jgi:hypothetical protein
MVGRSLVATSSFIMFGEYVFKILLRTMYIDAHFREITHDEINFPNTEEYNTTIGSYLL